jgi:uncharacterized protein (TIGR00725 family)
MGSGTVEHTRRSACLGRWLAERGVHLLTGGGGGVMAAVSKAFYEVPDRRGLVIAIVPSREASVSPKAGYPNECVEIPILTHLPLSGERGTQPLSRNHINVLTSDVIVALPGSAGTASEVALALAYRRPIVAFLDSPDEIPGLSDQVPVHANFAGVQKFVEDSLAALPSRFPGTSPATH